MFSNPWVQLAIAGIFEVMWALGLKLSDGFSRVVPSIFTAAAMVATYVFLALAMRTIPLGTAYAIWTGIGVIGAAIGGVIFFGEPVTALRVACIVLILIGAAGLKLTA